MAAFELPSCLLFERAAAAAEAAEAAAVLPVHYNSSIIVRFGGEGK